MLYVKVKENGLIFPYTFNELRLDNPNTSFPEFPTSEELAFFNVFPVKDIPFPEGYNSFTHTAEKGTPYNNGTEWVYDWIITPVDVASLELNIRGVRNSLLSSTDWTQISDCTVNKQAWAEYRQALRDITNQPNFPFEVIWPEQPSL